MKNFFSRLGAVALLAAVPALAHTSVADRFASAPEPVVLMLVGAGFVAIAFVRRSAADR